MKQTMSLVAICLTSVCSTGRAADVPIVKGGGATFPAPIYQLAIADFETKNSNLGARLLYNQTARDRKPEPVGSLKGIRLVQSRSLDFAGTDWPLTKEQLTRINPRAVQIPSVVGAVVIIYNLPQLNDSKVIRLNFSAEVLAQIFQGRVTRWDDALIQRLNPDVILPSEDIIPIRRSDGSGSTHMLANFLTQNSTSWTGGNDYEVKRWAPGSMAVDGSQHLAETVANTPSSIGYVEFEYADRNRLVPASIQLEWQEKTLIAVPSVAAIKAATPRNTVALLSADPDKYDEIQQQFPKSVYTSGNSQLIPYPISGFSWLVLKPLDGNSRKVLCEFLGFLPGWFEEKAQAYRYASVPADVVKANARKIAELCGP